MMVTSHIEFEKTFPVPGLFPCKKEEKATTIDRGSDAC